MKMDVEIGPCYLTEMFAPWVCCDSFFALCSCYGAATSGVWDMYG